jgi:hypothetical protein
MWVFIAIFNAKELISIDKPPEFFFMKQQGLSSQKIAEGGQSPLACAPD